jgi:inner membrane transporter RhtA
VRGGVALAVTATVSVQLGAALAKPLFDRVGPGGVVWLRLAFAAAILLLWTRPRLAGRSRGELLRVVCLGLASAGVTLTFFEAIDRIPLGVAVTIEFLGPLGVALAGSRRALDVVWVLLAGAGVTALALGDPVHGGLDGLGVALAAAAGVCWAAYIVLTKRMGREWQGAEGLAVSLTVAALATTPFGVAGGGGTLAQPDVLAACLALALLIPLLPYVCELAALRRLPTRVFGVLMSSEPAFAAVIGMLLLDERLRPAGVAAVLLIMAASAGSVLGAREREPLEAALVP